jgi:hypothetical protein
MSYVAGLREKYEDDDKKLNDETPALYVDTVCDYLDSLVQKNLEQRNVEVSVGPPAKWGCASWAGALYKNPKRTAEFLRRASAAAWSGKFTLLMAWNTWGRIGEPRTRLPNKPCMAKKEETAAERAARKKAFYAERDKAKAAAKKAVQEEAERWVAKYHSDEYAQMKEKAKQGKFFSKDEGAKKAEELDAEGWMAKYYPDKYALMKAQIEAKQSKLLPKKDKKDEQ